MHSVPDPQPGTFIKQVHQANWQWPLLKQCLLSCRNCFIQPLFIQVDSVTTVSSVLHAVFIFILSICFYSPRRSHIFFFLFSVLLLKEDAVWISVLADLTTPGATGVNSKYNLIQQATEYWRCGFITDCGQKWPSSMLL